MTVAFFAPCFGQQEENQIEKSLNSLDDGNEGEMFSAQQASCDIGDCPSAAPFVGCSDFCPCDFDPLAIYDFDSVTDYSPNNANLMLWDGATLNDGLLEIKPYSDQAALLDPSILQGRSSFSLTFDFMFCDYPDSLDGHAKALFSAVNRRETTKF